MQKSNFFISIVIPVYNRRKLLDKVLESICSPNVQYNFYEILVVDDGSKEDIESICSTIRTTYKVNIKYIRQENAGPAAARNKGVSHAKGEWIAFIDSDVIIDKNWFNTIQNTLTNFTRTNVINEIGALEGKTIVSNPENRTPFTHQTENLDGGKYPTCNMLIRKNFSHFNTKYKMQFREDSDLAFSILQSGYKIQFIPEMIVYHPPLPANLRMPLKLAARYRYDALLKARFPDLFVKHLDIHKIGPFQIANLRKKIYNIYITLLIISILNIIYWQLPFVHIPFVLAYLLVVYLHIRRTKFTFKRLLQFVFVFAIAAFVPIVYLYNSVIGLVQFRKEEEFNAKNWLKSSN